MCVAIYLSRLSNKYYWHMRSPYSFEKLSRKPKPSCVGKG